MLSSKLPCAHCGRTVDLVEGHFRIPRFGGRWWEFGEETSRYRCAACEGINRVKMGRIALALLVALVAGFALGWSYFEVNKQMLITGAVVALLLILMNGWVLAKE
jgi:hypothetical protein